MKNIITSALFAVILGLNACQFGTESKKVKPDIFKDTLVYSYQNIHERAPDCGNKADSACTVVSIKYPVFEKMPMLSDTIVKKLAQLGIMNDRKADTSLALVAKKFIQSYVDFKKTDKRSQMFFTMESYAKVLAQDSSLVALEYGGYNYQGGAHGGSFTGFINWNPKTGKQLELKDIIAEGKYPELSKIAEGIFRKSEKLSDTSSLARDYFFKDNKFALNENYSLTPTGLRFVYNQYEIKPYAAGQTELLVPYSSIKNILRPHTAISQYVK
ncbi:MAG: DUF3298 domain-containing protein [Mucilaginibacter sp.]|nr:DUF3298 domain-containing protein [Mucilaginibacter sp.]